MEMFHCIMVAYLLIIVVFVDGNWAKLEVHSDKHSDGITPPSSNLKGHKDEHVESENHAKLCKL